MARASRSRMIDGLTFTVQQLPATRGLLLFHKLLRCVGPSILRSLGTGKLSLDLKSLNLASVGDALERVLEKFSAEDLDAMRRDLFETATVTEGAQTLPLAQVFEEAMAGRPFTTLKALQFALEVNFESFFGVLQGAVAAQEASQSKT